MNTMAFKGYHARIAFDPDDALFIGRLVGINGVVGFHADTVAGLTAAFHAAVDDYIAACEAAGKAPEKLYSGKLMLRVAPEIHARAALAAQLEGKSLNQWGEEVLAKASRAAIG